MILRYLVLSTGPFGVGHPLWTWLADGPYFICFPLLLIYTRLASCLPAQMPFDSLMATHLTQNCSDLDPLGVCITTHTHTHIYLTSVWWLLCWVKKSISFSLPPHNTGTHSRHNLFLCPSHFCLLQWGKESASICQSGSPERDPNIPVGRFVCTRVCVCRVYTVCSWITWPDWAGKHVYV